MTTVNRRAPKKQRTSDDFVATNDIEEISKFMNTSLNLNLKRFAEVIHRKIIHRITGFQREGQRTIITSLNYENETLFCNFQGYSKNLKHGQFRIEYEKDHKYSRRRYILGNYVEGKVEGIVKALDYVPVAYFDKKVQKTQMIQQFYEYFYENDILKHITAFTKSETKLFRIDVEPLGNRVKSSFFDYVVDLVNNVTMLCTRIEDFGNLRRYKHSNVVEVITSTKIVERAVIRDFENKTFKVKRTRSLVKCKKSLKDFENIVERRYDTNDNVILEFERNEDRTVLTTGTLQFSYEKEEAEEIMSRKDEEYSTLYHKSSNPFEIGDLGILESSKFNGYEVISAFRSYSALFYDPVLTLNVENDEGEIVKLTRTLNGETVQTTS